MFGSFSLLHAVRLAHSNIRERMKAKKRSPKWEHVRDAFLAENPTCSACGGKKNMQVHHVAPYHLKPELELDHENFIGLCMGPRDCHLFVGHGGSFRCYNPEVRSTAQMFFVAVNHPTYAKKLCAAVVETAKKNRLKD